MLDSVYQGALLFIFTIIYYVKKKTHPVLLTFPALAVHISPIVVWDSI